MKHFTTARARIERRYRSALRDILEQRPYECAGCKYNQGLTPSHRIPRSRRRDLIADPENIDLMCTECHDKVETGRYDELNNGEEILAYILDVDPEYHAIKTILKGKDSGEGMDD